MKAALTAALVGILALLVAAYGAFRERLRRR